MCGIGGILRIVKPGDPDYPAPDDPRGEPSGAWLWHGLDARDLAYHRLEPQAPSPKPQAPSWLIPESWLDAIDENIKWRGPDGAGRFRDRVVRPDGSIVEVALVHRRLSIIDLECGAQPMVVTKCPRCAEKALGTGHQALVPNAQCQVPPLSAIVFNGCIYNHRELRAELEAKGHVFESDHSDTEVILHAVREWGKEAPNHFDGMFVFAIWDRERCLMAFARDGLGEKPLYDSVCHGRSVALFANTVPAIEAARLAISEPIVVRELDLATDWLVNGYCWLSPVEYDTDVRIGEWRETPYPEDRPFEHGSARISLDNWGSMEPGKERLSIDRCESLLNAAVKSRLVSDVRLGCFLSGGVDSSLVALFARRHLGDLTTITVRMPDERYDESRYAERVATHLGTHHVTLDCDATNAAGDLTRLIETLGLPFGDSSILPTYWLCREARRHVKVALAGDGGDELFFGYDRYKACGPLKWGRWPLMAVPTRWLNLSDPAAFSSRLERLVVAARCSGWDQLERIFQTPDTRRLLGAGADPHLYYLAPSRTKARSRDLRLYLPNDLMRKVDTASMLCNIEVRCPFLAKSVVEAALATPARIHMRGGETKHLLKELARKHLPREIVDRPKQGFAIPISDWWRNNFGGLQTLLLDMLAGERPFGQVHEVLEINMDYVRQMLDEHWAAGGLTPMHTTRHVRRRDHGQRLFALVSLAIWARSIHRGDAENAEKDQGVGSGE